MKLTVDKCWKYICKDSDGSIGLSKDKPKFDKWEWLGDEIVSVCRDLFDLDLGSPEDSLHEILEDGTLVKVNTWIPAKDEKVMVSSYKDGRYAKRFSTGKVTSENFLLCYRSGYTSWIDGGTVDWPHWRKPTEEELKDAN